MEQRSAATIGLDVGDKHSQVCILDAIMGEALEESRIRTTPAGIRSSSRLDFIAEPPAAVLPRPRGEPSRQVASSRRLKASRSYRMSPAGKGRGSLLWARSAM